eukprot:CAMPEP_0201487996 /NCGR_PEP_ID=MMETSP0151_2-20130828/16477_1 /ASSEMBLY_ACC=CAM_ASM_000257 /TAXON_ID=200890 /ORGANISM="Paramoeba atlantica, Strain 621/1 / CCAP 1560/9" /LENGTH=299 /DNA_ID=CAMNT_0047873195 /DNA_START=214 /DNA_END=1110 /DNA_ORIENTATION=+
MLALIAKYYQQRDQISFDQSHSGARSEQQQHGVEQGPFHNAHQNQAVNEREIEGAEKSKEEDHHDHDHDHGDERGEKSERREEGNWREQQNGGGGGNPFHFDSSHGYSQPSFPSYSHSFYSSSYQQNETLSSSFPHPSPSPSPSSPHSQYPQNTQYPSSSSPSPSDMPIYSQDQQYNSLYSPYHQPDHREETEEEKRQDLRGGEQEIGEGGGRRQERVENEGDEGKERKKPQKDSKGFERTLSEFYEDEEVAGVVRVLQILKKGVKFVLRDGLFYFFLTYFVTSEISALHCDGLPIVAW